MGVKYGSYTPAKTNISERDLRCDASCPDNDDDRYLQLRTRLTACPAVIRLSTKYLSRLVRKKKSQLV